MCTEQFIWYQEPAIWAAIIAGIFTVISGVATVLLYKKKNSIVHKFNADLETHKANLNKELEITKLQLAPLQEKRLESIKTVYVLLYEIYGCVKVLKECQSSPATMIDDNLNKQIYDKSIELMNTWHIHKLYFSKSLAADIEELIALSIKSAGVIMFSKNDALHEFAKTSIEFDINKLIRELNASSIEELFTKIEREFRSIMGVGN